MAAHIVNATSAGTWLLNVWLIPTTKYCN